MCDLPLRAGLARWDSNLTHWRLPGLSQLWSIYRPPSPDSVVDHGYWSSHWKVQKPACSVPWIYLLIKVSYSTFTVSLDFHVLHRVKSSLRIFKSQDYRIPWRKLLFQTSDLLYSYKIAVEHLKIILISTSNCHSPPFSKHTHTHTRWWSVKAEISVSTLSLSSPPTPSLSFIWYWTHHFICLPPFLDWRWDRKLLLSLSFYFISHVIC